MKAMRIVKIMLTVLIITGLTIPSLSCTPEPDTTSAPENQVFTVERGNLIIDITASGNLALSLKEDLAFEVSGTEQEPLTVEEVLVEEGDSVEEGQILVTLDTTALEEKVTSREQAFQIAELAVTTAEIDVQIAKDAEETVRAAEIDLETATDNFRKITYPYTYSTFTFDVPVAIVAIRDAERQLAEVRTGLEVGSGSEEYDELWHNLGSAQDNLVQARERLLRGVGVDQFVAYGGDPPLAIEDFWTLRAAQLAMEKAQSTLDKAKRSFESGLNKAEVALDKAEVALEEARYDRDKAKDDLEKAVVVAPFAGFITAVNVEGGDEVKRGTVAVQLADPDKFEAEVMVGEMDILQLKLGADAIVQVDAMPEISLPAKVTHISPTATIQSGVVNYEVKVELQSLQPVQQEQQKTQQKAIESISPGELPPGLQQAVEEGRITREQALEIIQSRQQGQGEQQAQKPLTIPQDFQLREGLTVTVSILVQENKNVLMVPNRTVTRRGQETYVQVVSPDGVTEERAIKTGISNWTHTEVTEGLSEGEEVVIPQATTETTQSSTSRSPMPFLGPPGRAR